MHKQKDFTQVINFNLEFYLRLAQLGNIDEW